MLGTALAVLRRDAVVLAPAPPRLELSLVETTAEMPALSVPDPAEAVEAARSVATTTTPPPVTTTTQRPSPTPREAPGVARPESAPAPESSALGDRIVATARTFFGIPYVWGGTTRAGLDCSGLTYLVLRAHGLTPPRTAATQAAWATRISASQARPGDLVFSGNPATHVGIYIGNGRMIDAATFGTVVAERPVMRGAYYGRVT